MNIHIDNMYSYINPINIPVYNLLMYLLGERYWLM